MLEVAKRPNYKTGDEHHSIQTLLQSTSRRCSIRSGWLLLPNRRETGDGRWEMGDGRWEMGDGRWEMGDGRRESRLRRGEGSRERRTESGAKGGRGERHLTRAPWPAIVAALQRGNRNMRIFAALLLLVLCGAMATTPLSAQPTTTKRDLPPGLQIPDAARPGPTFDVDRATEAYLDLLSPEQRASSDAYFEGGYWLQLFAFLY